jgi:hypothetical protein
MPLKTLFLIPPSFENFDGGAGSRWPATREIESYWYPVWLAYPTGMLEGARLLDAPPHHITAEETIRTCKDYELLVLFTSTPGFAGDVRIAEAIKDSNPHIKIAFVGPHVSVLPEKSLMEAKVIDVVCRKEFDYSIVEYAQGNPIDDTGPGFAAARDRCLPARSGRAPLQRALPAESICVALHHSRMPRAMHLLPLAPDPQRTPLAQTLDR